MKPFIKISVLATLLLLMGTSAKRRPTTLFMAGDSTMADKEELVESPERGWGQLFPTYVKENLHIENHAKNGRSTRSFITEGRWDDLLSRVQKGDILNKINDTKVYIADELDRQIEEAVLSGEPLRLEFISAENGEAYFAEISLKEQE